MIFDPLKMSFVQAMESLNQGKIIKLPEWTGYWFKDGKGTTKVLTKNGDLLDTPDYSTFSTRNDWQVTEGKMGFDFAILALKNDKLVSREKWYNEGYPYPCFVYRTIGNVVSKDFIPKFASLPAEVKEKLRLVDKDVTFKPSFTLYQGEGIMQPGWIPTEEDMLADDWTVII